MRRLSIIHVVCAFGVAGGVLALRFKSSEDGTTSSGRLPQGGVIGTRKPPSSSPPAHVEDAITSHAEKLFEAGGWAAVIADINASVAPDSRVGRTILTAKNLIYEDSSRTSSILSAIPLGAVRQRVMVNLASGTSPEAARRVLDWVITNGFPEEVTSVIHSFSLRTLTVEDEAFITGKLNDEAHVALKPLLVNLKAQAMAARGDSKEVGRLLSEVPENFLPADYQVSIIGSLSRGGHLNAETLSSLPPAVQKTGWTQLSYEACNGNEAGGIEWINQNVPSQHRAAVAGALFSRWVDIDPLAASEAVRTLPPGEMRNSGIKNLVGYLKSKGDTAAAADWEAQLPPPK
ncbi:MAG: hypothetical protein RLZZ179_3180 [Verrucomicrobiota bacterium]|jgi:hypothetical protein